MLYWTGKKGYSLEKELMDRGEVTGLHIASAYLSGEGVGLIARLKERYRLQPGKIQVFLSQEFCPQDPADILEQLKKLCRLRIVREPFLHAKAFWFEGRPSTLILGSANLTRGGVERNIELEEILTLDQEAEGGVREFFRYCEERSVPADDGMIAYYRRIQDELRELEKGQRKLRARMRGYGKEADPFSEEEYDLSGFYFTFEDYETFFLRNQTGNDMELKKRREAVQKKLLDLHKAIYPEIEKLDLSCHWDNHHITSLVYPHPKYNSDRVAWLGVRYGKHRWELGILNEEKTWRNDVIYGFQKHSCLQFCIFPEGFEIDLYHAVRQDAVDRSWLVDNKKACAPKIVEALNKLKGQHMEWHIQDETGKDVWVFDVDTEAPEDFIREYWRHDGEGCESFLRLRFAPGDPQIKTAEGLKGLIVEKMTAMLPLYNAMVWRIGEDQKS